MVIANEVATALNKELGKHGISDISFSKNIFSGKSSEKAGISGEIKGRPFRVIMFEPAKESGILSISAYLFSSIKDIRLSDEQIAFWNTDNRFTKLYRQDDSEIVISLDSFFPSSLEEYFIKSFVQIWVLAISELSTFKAACERRDIF